MFALDHGHRSRTHEPTELVDDQARGLEAVVTSDASHGDAEVDQVVLDGRGQRRDATEQDGVGHPPANDLRLDRGRQPGRVAQQQRGVQRTGQDRPAEGVGVVSGGGDDDGVGFDDGDLGSGCGGGRTGGTLDPSDQPLLVDRRRAGVQGDRHVLGATLPGGVGAGEVVAGTTRVEQQVDQRLGGLSHGDLDRAVVELDPADLEQLERLADVHVLLGGQQVAAGRRVNGALLAGRRAGPVDGRVLALPVEVHRGRPLGTLDRFPVPCLGGGRHDLGTALVEELQRHLDGRALRGHPARHALVEHIGRVDRVDQPRDDGSFDEDAQGVAQPAESAKDALVAVAGGLGQVDVAEGLQAVLVGGEATLLHAGEDVVVDQGERQLVDLVVDVDVARPEDGDVVVVDHGRAAVLVHVEHRVGLPVTDDRCDGL